MSGGRRQTPRERRPDGKTRSCERHPACRVGKTAMENLRIHANPSEGMTP
ncbi:hypothetical protein A33M_3119 [Rhodovulum sp. PH10]|nr:hypothetical protein A33M_3119 [Rhodovulum sp. PH10]